MHHIVIVEPQLVSRSGVGHAGPGERNLSRKEQHTHRYGGWKWAGHG